MDIRKSISSVLGRDKTDTEVDSSCVEEETNEGMMSQRRSLVLRRQDGKVGDKIVIRLSPDIPRDSELAMLMAQGIIIDVIKIQKGSAGRPNQVSLAIGAPDEFLIDRAEKFEAPRADPGDLQNSGKTIDDLSRHHLVAMTIEQVDERIQAITELDTTLQTRVRALKLDRKKAHDAGQHRRRDANYSTYLVINEEIDIILSKRDQLKAALSQAKGVRKAKAIEMDRQAQDAWARLFTKTAKSVLDKSQYQAIVEASQATLSRTGATN